MIVERVGDVLGCHFADEEDVALFIPGSGDVLLSSLQQWRHLKDGGKILSTHSPENSLTDSPPDSPADSTDAAGPGREEPADELKSALLSLGAALE